MDIMTLIACEDAFTAAFCQVEVQPDRIRYTDPKIPDMYDHHYTILLDLDAASLRTAVEEELARSLAQGLAFCNVRVRPGADTSFIPQLSHAPDVTHYGIFAAPIAALSIGGREDIAIRRITDDQGIADRIAVELAGYSGSHGGDFIVRKGARNGEVYIPDGLVDSYVAYLDGEPAGKADLFCHDGVAMIEDFDVVPSQRRKGIGTAVIRELVKAAAAHGARDAMLVTDLGDTAQDVYRKLGFVCHPGYTELFFKLA